MTITVAADELELLERIAAADGAGLGLNYVVRHPEPRLECYTLDRAQDRDRGLAECYTARGCAEVAAFAAHMVDVVRRIAPAGGVALHYSKLWRTELFARTVAAALVHGTTARVGEPALLDALYGDSAAQNLALCEAGHPEFATFADELRAERAKAQGMTPGLIALLRSWLPAWLRESPAARESVAELGPLVAHPGPGQVRLYFTHEHIQAALLHAMAPAGSAFCEPAHCFLGTAAYLCVLDEGNCVVVDHSANSEVPRLA